VALFIFCACGNSTGAWGFLWLVLVFMFDLLQYIELQLHFRMDPGSEIPEICCYKKIIDSCSLESDETEVC